MTGRRDAFGYAPVRPGRVVVHLILSQDGVQVCLAEDQHAVEDFAAQGADKALAGRVHARSLDRGAPTRRGAGSMPAARRISHTVDGATVTPSTARPSIRRTSRQTILSSTRPANHHGALALAKAQVSRAIDYSSGTGSAKGPIMSSRPRSWKPMNQAFTRNIVRFSSVQQDSNLRTGL